MSENYPRSSWLFASEGAVTFQRLKWPLAIPSIPGGAQEILRLVLHFSFLLPETCCWHHLRDPSYVMHKRPALEVQPVCILQCHSWQLGCLWQSDRSIGSTHFFWFLAQLFQSLLMIRETGPYDRLNSEIRGHWWWNEGVGSRHIDLPTYSELAVRRADIFPLALPHYVDDLGQVTCFLWASVSHWSMEGLDQRPWSVIYSVNKTTVIYPLEGAPEKRDNEAWQWCSNESKIWSAHLLPRIGIDILLFSSLAATPLCWFWWKRDIFSKLPREIALGWYFPNWSILGMCDTLRTSC